MQRRHALGGHGHARHQLPFGPAGLLPHPTPVGHRRRGYLVERFEIATAPSASVELALDARLVVLGACQTAAGSGLRADVPAGDEWVSLTQAFLAAGAQRVVATLRPVDDRVTAQLMATLHEGLASGSGEAHALAEAQRRALADERSADPFYWAGLALKGGP